MEKWRTYFVLVLVGLVLGASIGIGFYRSASVSVRAERDQLRSAVAEWRERAGQLDTELRSVRDQAEANRRLDEEIARTLREGIAAVNAARTDYERGIQQLYFARDIFNILRERYDPDYKTPGESTG